jgi:opacity protein-like surface antigen
MKLNSSPLRKAAITLALLCPFVALSQEGLYLQGGVGGNITHSTELKAFFGDDVTGATVKFDPGYSVNVDAGYDLCKWFAVEGEVGAFVNNIKSISGADRVDAVFANVPFLLNARLQVPKQCRFSPYIGGGVGGAASLLGVDHIDRDDIHVHGSAGDVVFAYQGFAGFRVALNDRMGLGFEYRYFHAGAPTWKSEDDFSNTSSDRMKFGQAETHSFSVTFDWRF